jgi:hypothetical protein
VSRPRGALAEATIALGLVVIASTAAGAPPKPAPRPAGPAKAAAPSTPVAPLPMLPSIPRVKIDVLKGQLVVIEEVNLPRGEWKGDALDFYVAFGAPGVPRAIDARLVPVGDGALEPEDDEAGEPLVVDRAPRRPASAHPLIGRDTMAGVVVHVKREALTRALEPGNMAALRVRTALDLPEEDSLGARGVVVRLGSSRGTPLTLGRLTLTAKAGAPNPSRAEAHLCGADADPTPLAIALVPKPPPPPAPSSAAPATPPAPPIAPVLAVRHATDDVCIRFWTPP